MNFRTTCVTFASLALLLGSSIAPAADTKATAETHASSKAKSSAKSADSKLIDINNAKATELKTLPGIGDPEAQKIIANRPYSTKAQLVVRNIVDGATYEGLRKKVVARQPYKDAAKNAALYAKQK